MNDQPIYQRDFKPNGEIKIYPNRVYIKLKIGLFGYKEETVLIKNVAAVDLEGVVKRLKIKTNGGQVYEHPHAVGKTAEEIQRVLLGLL